MVRNLSLSLAFVVLGAASVSCGFDADPIAGACVEGQQMGCSCSGGRIGVHRCRPDSTFGPCACSAIDVGAPGNAGQDGGAPDSGTTGSNAGGPPATAGNSAKAGAGAAGSGAAGRAGNGGASGRSGSSGSGGNGGTGGDPDDAGEGGESGEGGEAGEDGESGEGGAGSGGPPEPGGPYSSCSDDTDCDDPLVCAIGTQNEPGTGYCTGFCNPMGGMTCPQPPSGTVKGMCLSLGVGICILSNCQDDTCPDGMDCIRAGQDGPFGPGQHICQYTSSGSGP
jgi:hypothetical protein